MNELELKILRSILAGYNEDQSWGYWKSGTFLEIPFYGTVDVIKRDEPIFDYDSGQPTVIIFRLQRGQYTLYFKKTAYANSYDGMDWSTGSFFPVKPVERPVIDYV